MGMDDIQDAILEAWERVERELLGDPEELQRRISRRERASMRMPPRAWCLAVRASDTRVDRYCTSIPNKGKRHQVILDSEALARLCAPVSIEPPGEAVEDVAKKLGVIRAG